MPFIVNSVDVDGVERHVAIIDGDDPILKPVNDRQRKAWKGMKLVAYRAVVQESKKWPGCPQYEALDDIPLEVTVT